MAKKTKNIQRTAEISTVSFNKGMMKDLNPSLIPQGSYISARNAINNSHQGDYGIIENEQSNLFCANAPYTVIGAIYLYDSKWAIFSTDDINSEIGLFDEKTCNYSTIVNDECLGFKKTNLIIGEAVQRFDCDWYLYWSDGLNPDRYLNINKVPYIQNCTTIDDCTECVDTDQLDCNKIRLAPLYEPPCISIKASSSGGEILNGSYQAFIAYAEDGIRISDYSTPSNVISLFDHSNVNGGLEVNINSIDTSYSQFELVIAGFVNNKLVAKRIGIYSTKENIIRLDAIDPELESVPLELLTFDVPAYEKSQGIYKVNNYLIRVSPTSRFDFNYQPLANQINTKWVAVKYKKDYYRNSNTNTEAFNTGYLRDEVYSFFIRFVYDTGDKSSAYHIPGRDPLPGETTTIASSIYGTEKYFEANNTATITSTSTYTLPDGGEVYREGNMAYWESTEKYPDDKPDVWGNLCGKPIRHHKMPDETKTGPIYDVITDKISVLGIKFENIQYPVDNAGNPIPGIVGYEILRGKRDGNKTIIAKGVLKDMIHYRRYDNTGQIALCQNYPYNQLGNDPFLTNSSGFYHTDSSGFSQDLNVYTSKYASFHSPETSFKHPYLSAKELRIYKNVYGDAFGKYVYPENHPKHKVITDLAFAIAMVVGLLQSLRKNTMKKKIRGELGVDVGGYPAVSAVGTGIIQAAIWANPVTSIPINSNYTTFDLSSAVPGGFIANAATLGGIGAGSIHLEYDKSTELGAEGSLMIALTQATAFTYLWPYHTDELIKLIKNIGGWKQHALTLRTHAEINRQVDYSTPYRTKIEDGAYMKNNMLSFDNQHVNNLWRTDAVILKAKSILPRPVKTDSSKKTFSQIFGGSREDIGREAKIGLASMNYAALKQRIQNLYGQLDKIQIVPISCTLSIGFNETITETPVLFGGDIYIGRFTQKDTFFFFHEWLMNLPNGTEFNYRDYVNTAVPRYWFDFTDYDFSDFVSNTISAVSSAITSLFGGSEPTSTDIIPSNYHNTDSGSKPGVLLLNERYFYLFVSGVLDFFVESEFNVEQRDWGDKPELRHYDPYGYIDYNSLFKTDIIKEPNLYKYDTSLSISRYYSAYYSFGSTQNLFNYDPTLEETCFKNYPNRVIYSLPYKRSSRLDTFKVYLVDNYHDFSSNVLSFKPINKTGAVVFFKDASPQQFIGIDQLQTDLGTKITIGDGGLFANQPQRIVNSDLPIEYGACQDRLSIINTPTGLYWISQNQGKIFRFTGSLEDISYKGISIWLKYNLPYKLLKDFPDYDLVGNPVIGIGCQTVYDSSYTKVYFSKRDFKLKKEYKGLVTYIGENKFQYKSDIFELGNERYFEDASWTLSYDSALNVWVSFHDWHPNLSLSSVHHFLTIKNNSIWKHNIRNDSYCNFYNVNYPFEIEIPVSTGQSVTTLKSVEYQMEVFKWNGADKFHSLDFNFDRAYIYNTEQISGELKLILKPKNNAPLLVTYPRINSTNIEILYSKEEQKYKFNQFWDIIRDRGEFTTAERNMWITKPNGYIKELNPLAIDYNKANTQRKKFRHTYNILLLRRLVCGAYNMQLKLINNKNQQSLR